MHESILLHVGYIKTASTFLQENIFSGRCGDVELASGFDTRSHLVEKIILANDYSFDYVSVFNNLESIAKAVRGRNKLPVWSEETLLGDPVTRRYDGFNNLRKLKLVYPNAKLLITIRNQFSIILSMYGEYIRGGGILKFQDFIGREDSPISFRPILRAEFLKYDEAISHAKFLFGDSNVLVLPQELLEKDLHLYVEILSEFLGRSLNFESMQEKNHVSEKQIVILLRRFLNRFITINPNYPKRRGFSLFVDYFLNILNKLIPPIFEKSIYESHHKAARKFFKGKYGRSNEITQSLISFDLKKFGYDME